MKSLLKTQEEPTLKGETMTERYVTVFLLLFSFCLFLVFSF